MSAAWRLTKLADVDAVDYQVSSKRSCALDETQEEQSSFYSMVNRSHVIPVSHNEFSTAGARKKKDLLLTADMSVLSAYIIISIFH